MRAILTLVLSLAVAGAWAAEPATAPVVDDPPSTDGDTAIGSGDTGGAPEPFDWTPLLEDDRVERWTIENKKARVEISSWRGSIRRFWLRDAHPIPLPTWRGGVGDVEPGPDGELPDLTVLDLYNQPTQAQQRSFQFATDMHSYIGSLPGLRETGSSPAEGPWRLVRKSDAGDALLLEKEVEPGLRYRLSYTMDPERPTVHVQLRMRNGTDAARSCQPTLVAVNGIHQDDPGRENYDLRVVGSFDGDDDGHGALFEKWSMPAPLQRTKLFHPELKTPVVPAGRVNYVGLKSRFFTAFWSPGSVRVTDPSAPEAAAEPVTREQDMGAMFQDASPVDRLAIPADDHLVRMVACGYLQRFGTEQQYRAPQAWIALQMYPPGDGGAFEVGPDEALEISWSLTASGMRKKDLALLTPAEARIEYTDGFYNFFKLLVQILAAVLDTVVVVVQNYGVAVIVFVFLVKALLHRLNVKQQKGMANMQRMAPKLKELQERYKADRQTLARKQMEMMREEGVNPLGGCLPLLIQMPIFFAMFQTFRHYAPMREHGFLWIDDLTMPDQVWPLFTIGTFTLTLNLLPLLYIGIMSWSSFSTKIPDDAPDQQKSVAKLMRWLPIVFGVICYNFPSGLLLYMCCSALIGTLEMRWIRKKYGAGSVSPMMTA